MMMYCRTSYQNFLFVGLPMVTAAVMVAVSTVTTPMTRKAINTVISPCKIKKVI